MRTITENKCKKCGYRWFPRQDKPAKRCPNPLCASPYWLTGEGRPKAKRKDAA